MCDVPPIWMGPGARRHTTTKADRHQFMIAGMKIHLVDPVTPAVERTKYWWIAVGGDAKIYSVLETSLFSESGKMSRMT